MVVSFFGDGANNEGAFHEALNMASIWKLPVIFVCENNGYAQATPVEYAVAVRDIAARAAGYAMPGVVVDGQDVFAVLEAAEAAVRRARAIASCTASATAEKSLPSTVTPGIE